MVRQFAFNLPWHCYFVACIIIYRGICGQKSLLNTTYTHCATILLHLIANLVLFMLVCVCVREYGTRTGHFNLQSSILRYKYLLRISSLHYRYCMKTTTLEILFVARHFQSDSGQDAYAGLLSI